jgi:2'-5' RNA ligase
MTESALIVAVPEAEPVVGRFREKYDSSAAVGVPAHVTLLYPFLDPSTIGASDVAALTTLFASTRPIDVTFARCARFDPRVLYLAPEPQTPLLELMRRIWDRWPALPPYSGTIPRDVVRPHLTVSDSVTGDQLDRIDLAVAGGLPIRTRFAEALLIDNRSGRWTTRERFTLG